MAAHTISSELKRIAEISEAVFGSEDDLQKIIPPFFQVVTAPIWMPGYTR
jgi:hypothetical protein